MTSPSVLAAGEATIDMYLDPDAETAIGGRFTSHPGGGPVNLTAALSSFGANPVIWTRVGSTPFGNGLRQTLVDRGVSTRLVGVDERRVTPLSFIGFRGTDQGFAFYFENSTMCSLTLPGAAADTLIDVDWVVLSGAALAFESSREALLSLASEAASMGCTVMLDVNARPSLWPNPSKIDCVLGEILESVDIVKCSTEDIEATNFPQDSDEIIATALSAYGPHTVFVTDGENGAYGRSGPNAPWGDAEASMEAFSVTPVDPVGAGDAFSAGVVESLCRRESDDITNALEIGCAAGAITTTRERAFPREKFSEDVNVLLNE